MLVGGGCIDKESITRLLEPQRDVAPTGNKQYNGMAERAVQSIKLIQKCLVSHLTKSGDQYLEESFKLAEVIYNRTPHSGLKGILPYNKYFDRSKSKVDMENNEERIAQLEVQPAHVYRNIQTTLPRMPMFLEDGLYAVATPKGSVLHPCYFLGLTEENKFIVKLPKGVDTMNWRTKQNIQMLQLNLSN